MLARNLLFLFFLAPFFLSPSVMAQSYTRAQQAVRPSLAACAALNNAQPIHTVQEFDDIRLNLSGNYILRSNLDFQDTSRTPIGTLSQPFSGKLNGCGHRLENFRLSSGSNLGLFGVVSGEINRVTLRCFSSTGSSRVGSLVGRLESLGKVDRAVIEECPSADNQVSGSNGSTGVTGGLVAINFGTILNSVAHVNILSGNKAGNLVGVNEGIIERSTAFGTNEAAREAGGLVGVNDSGLIHRSSAHVDIGLQAGNTISSGGLVARNGPGSPDGLISESFATGEVFSSGFNPSSGLGAFAGGLVGENYDDVINSYSTGEVRQVCEDFFGFYFCWAGGLVGGLQAGGLIENSYTVSRVDPGSTANVGGLTAECFFGDVDRSYYDYQRTIAQGSCGSSITTSEMQSGDPFPDWDLGIWLFEQGSDPELLNAR